MSQALHLKSSTLIDIGANLSHESFRDDLGDVIKRACDSSIEAMILTGSDLESSLRAIEICADYPDYLYSTAGLHPHHASDYSQELANSLRELATQPCVKSLGETGLDFNRNYSPQAAQEKAFEEQLQLGVDLELPLFLHQRDAHHRFLPILKEFRDRLGNVVVHCFTGTREELYDYLDLDLYIGITGWVCDERRGYSLHPLLGSIPEQRLLLETDAPYLMPRNIRPRPSTRRNEPANLLFVLDMIASCLQKDPEELASQTSRNARDFFAL